jgi:hypothetical protein
LAVAALGIGGWQISQTMNELGETLATMNETQRALLASRAQEDRPLAIRGRLYLGDKTKPASYASVEVYPLPGGKMVDTLVADKDGRFGTSSLEAGHYTLVAKLLTNRVQTGTPPHPDPEFYVQSRPISVYPWSKDTTVELDVAMIEYGRLTFELTRPFPQKLEIDLSDNGDERKAIVYPALALAIPNNKRIETLPIRRLSDSPQFDWPVMGIKRGEVSEHAFFDATTVLNFGEYATNEWWPVGKPIAFPRLPTMRGVFSAGRYQVGAYMTFSYSVSEVPPDALFGERPAWQIIGESNLTTLPEESRASFEVVDHRRTHLRITPPEDLEQTLREAIAQTEGNERKLQELQQKPIAVKLEVVGQMDLFDPQEWRPQAPPAQPGYGGYGTSAGYGGAR